MTLFLPNSFTSPSKTVPRTEVPLGVVHNHTTPEWEVLRLIVVRGGPLSGHDTTDNRGFPWSSSSTKFNVVERSRDSMKRG